MFTADSVSQHSRALQPPRPSPTPPTTSFLPTEVIQSVPRISRRKSSKQEETKRRFEEPPATALLQQLNLLNTLMDSNESERKTNEKVKAILDGFEQQKSEPPLTRTQKVKPPTSTSLGALKDETGATLESLALLTSLLAATNEQNPKGTEPGSSPPQLRPIDDQEAANFLANLLLAKPLASKSPTKFQDFQSFSNSHVNMDTASSNQLSGLLSLLGTLGSLSGGGNLLSLGQAQTPNLLGLLGGNGQGGGNGGLLASMLGFNKHQTRNAQSHHQMSALANLLGNSGSGAFSNPQQNQPPGVVDSLVGLGSSVSTLLGHTFSGLSGTKPDGKPRVRGNYEQKLK